MDAQASISNALGRIGYRGYVASRPVRGSSFPQHVQNLVVRDYAARRGLPYLLSLTEYAMPDCFLMLEALLGELPKLRGVIFFSIFMLPENKLRRQNVFDRILSMGCELHTALENIALRSPDDIGAIEDLLDVALTLPRLPLRGRYEKDETSADERQRDPFWSTMAAAL
jgi:sporadic carbohydrate cluster protein (TIGR04323 family)